MEGHHLAVVQNWMDLTTPSTLGEGRSFLDSSEKESIRTCRGRDILLCLDKDDGSVCSTPSLPHPCARSICVCQTRESE